MVKTRKPKVQVDKTDWVVIASKVSPEVQRLMTRLSGMETEITGTQVSIAQVIGELVLRYGKEHLASRTLILPGANWNG